MATLKAGAKRSLFKKPTWASTSASTKTTNSKEENNPIFGQNHLYQDILDAEKKQRERHAAKRQEQAEAEKQKSLERGSKRRRISIEAEDSDEDERSSGARSDRSASVSSQQGQRSVTPAEEVERPNLESVSRKQKINTSRGTTPPRSIRTRSQKNQAYTEEGDIAPGDSESDDTTIPPRHEDQDLYGPHTKSSPHEQKPKSKSKSRQAESESESDEEDEYLRELKAEARRKARQAKIGIGVRQSNTPGPASRPGSIDPRSPGPRTDIQSPHKIPGDLTSPNLLSATATTMAEQEVPEDQIPEVKIWIKTIIPGAKDLIVNRRIDQPLDKVREFWIKRNELPPAIGQKVFFTWNSTRLYNSTTMRGIIERLKKTHPLQDGSNGDPSHGQITIEAVTDEIFEQRQKQKQRRLNETDDDDNNNNNNNNDNDADAESRRPITSTNELTTNTHHQPNPPSLQEPTQKEGTIIKLRAPGHEEMQLRVRSGTTMTKILQGYCRVRQIDTTRYAECWLSYDGDRLGGDATVEDVGFEGDDSVDVYLR